MLKIIPSRLLARACVCGVLAITFIPAGADDVASNSMTDRVHVEGVVKTPLELTVDDLRTLPVTEMKQVAMRCAPDRDKGSADYTGVLLREVLDKAQVDTDERHVRNRTYVAVMASDGYDVVFSWHELYNSNVGDGVLLFYERDGQPLGADDGQIALISARDTFTCGRHVKWVSRIRVARFEHGE